jgi:hypothetical protein
MGSAAPRGVVVNFFFGLGRGQLSDDEVERRQQIARKHGAAFTYTDLPGEGWRYWFATHRAVLAEVKESA